MTICPSPSRLGLAQRCLFPWLSGIRWQKRPADAYQGLGSAISSVAECCTAFGEAPLDVIVKANGVTGDAFGFMAEAVREQLAAEADTDRWRAAEVTLAWNVKSRRGRVLHRRHKRDYSAQDPDEIAGDADLVRVAGDGRLVVRDWKTGQYARYRRPRRMPQLLCYGMAAADALGFDEVTLELCQVDEVGIYTKSDALGAFELAIAASDLEHVFDRLDDPAQNVPRPGWHCREYYCPIIAECPATEAAVEAIADASKLAMGFETEITSAEQGAYQLERIKVVEAALKAADERLAVYKAAVKHFAATTPIPLDGGRIYGAREHTSETIKPTVEAMAVLQAELGDEADSVLKVERSVLKTAFSRACKKVAPPREGAKLERAIMARLRDAGAVDSSTYTKFEIFKPKKQT